MQNDKDNTIKVFTALLTKPLLCPFCKGKILGSERKASKEHYCENVLYCGFAWYEPTNV